MNSFQKTTPSGKPVINSITKLPEFTKSVNTRINNVKQQLGYSNNTASFEERWDNICTSVSVLNY